jgi:hypothetical protein
MRRFGYSSWLMTIIVRLAKHLGTEVVGWPSAGCRHYDMQCMTVKRKGMYTRTESDGLLMMRMSDGRRY